MGVVVKRFDVYLTNVDPSAGGEIKRIRPCLVISPDEMNQCIATIIVAPMTTRGRPYPTRVPCRFQGKHGQIALDQLRAIDKSRLVKQVGNIGAATQHAVIAKLAEMIAE